MLKKIVLLGFVFVLSLSTVFGTCFSPLLAENPETKIYVDPPVSKVSLGETFTVGVKVANVLNLYAYQFRMSWEPSLLNVTSVTEGPFLNAEGTHTTHLVKKIWNQPDPLGVSGYIYVACTLLGEPATAAASGNGTLATVEFVVNEVDNTSLHLYDTLLINSLKIEVPHETEGGYFQSYPYVVVDQAFVSDERADVGSVQTIGFHAKWGLNGSDVVGGSIFVNGTEYVTNGTGWINFDVSSPTVGQEEWVVTKVNCSRVTMYVQEVPNPSMVWDQIEIVDGGSTNQSVKLGEMTTIWFQATYEYDDVGFDDTKGILYVNEAEMTWSTPNDRWEYNYSVTFFGSIAFTITGFSDNLYGLTAINDPVGSQTIIPLEQPNLTVTLDCLTSYVGYKVKISGRLAHINGTSIAGANLLLTYSVTGGESWNDITLVTTTLDGDYYAEWMPTATGNYLIRVVWKEDEIPYLLGTEARVTLAVTPLEEKYVFSVVSNSTISELAFNTTDWTLSFTATGPNGTKGYTKITVAKTLVENITNIRVYLDGNQSEYSIASIDDSWLMTFDYIHSTHQLVVDLDITIIPEFPSFLILPLFMIATLLAVTIYKRKHSM